jgi:hypothetical protein
VTNPDLVELAMRAVQGTKVESAESNPIAAEPTGNLLREIIGLTAAQMPVEGPAAPDAAVSAKAHRDPTKQKKTAEELAAMILDDLSTVDGCPKRGVKVAVYGSNPWNSWLSFGGDAGPVRNRADLQTLCEIITERLKRLYDVH